MLFDYNIYPVPKYVIEETTEKFKYVKDEFFIDADFYTISDNLYPNKLVEIDNIDSIRGLNVITLNIYPLQYNPVTDELQVYSFIRFELKYKIPQEEINIFSAGPFENICEKIIVNWPSRNGIST